MRREYGAAVSLAVVSAALALATRDLPGGGFLTAANLANILGQVAVIAVLAAGSSLVIFSGGIDLSVGSLLAAAGAVAACALQAGGGPFIAIAAGLATGAAAGAVNGLVVARLHLPPFIATLGTMGIARGLTYVALGGAPRYGFPEPFLALAQSRIAGLPAAVWIMLALFVALHVLATRTTFGRNVFALGGNEEAARLAGVPVTTVKTAVYMVSGACAAVAGLLLAARLDSAEPQAGDGYELDAIAAAVLGGASLAGGEGTIGGTLIGALLMGVVRNGLNLLNVSAYWQKAAIGSIILGAVLLDVSRRRAR